MTKMTHNQLAALGAAERASALAALEADILYSSQPWESATVVTMLRGFEDRFGMSTAEMQERFAAGSLPDEGEISSWLFWARAGSHSRAQR
jgi:hypothetical protein